MTVYVWIGIGSALGGIARYACTQWIATHTTSVFPWGTLFVNVVGCFVMGALAMWSECEKSLLSPLTRQFLMVGLLGGYTTFSAFSIQTLTLLRAGAWLNACANIVLSLVLCLCAVWLGYAVMTNLFNRNL